MDDRPKCIKKYLGSYVRGANYGYISGTSAEAMRRWYTNTYKTMGEMGE